MTRRGSGVTPNSPMRRGLKSRRSSGGRFSKDVTPNSPMRRGLKSKCRRQLHYLRRRRHTEFPDEEGTEILLHIKEQYRMIKCHTEFPDEEGTEITGSGPRSSSTHRCHTEFPDEEGTEMFVAEAASVGLPGVTPNSPMRMGLKYFSLD